jgi:hypothetical protein
MPGDSECTLVSGGGQTGDRPGRHNVLSDIVLRWGAPEWSQGLFGKP